MRIKIEKTATGSFRAISFNDAVLTQWSWDTLPSAEIVEIIEAPTARAAYRMITKPV